MKIPPRPVLVLHQDRDLRLRLRTAAPPDYVYQPVRDWRALRKAVGAAPPSALVVVDAFAGTPGVIAGELSALLSEFPSVPVIAAMDVTTARTRDVLVLARLGVVDVIALGHDDTPEALRQRFGAASGRPLKAVLDRVLPDGLDGRVHALMDAAAEIVTAGLNSVHLARRLGLSRRTLLRWSLAARVPPPRRLLAWMRILLAAQLLDDPGRTVRSVALACGYSSDSGLRRVTTRFVGRSPTRMRRAGAFSVAAAGFLAELDRYRSTTAGGGE